MDRALQDGFWGFDGGFLPQLPRSTPSTQGKMQYLILTLRDLTVTVPYLCLQLLIHCLGKLDSLGTLPDKTQPKNAEERLGNVSPHSKDSAKLERIGPALSPTTKKRGHTNSFVSSEQEPSFSTNRGNDKERRLSSKDAKTINLTAQLLHMDIRSQNSQDALQAASSDPLPPAWYDCRANSLLRKFMYSPRRRSDHFLKLWLHRIRTDTIFNHYPDALIISESRTL